MNTRFAVVILVVQPTCRSWNPRSLLTKRTILLKRNHSNTKSTTTLGVLCSKRHFFTVTLLLYNKFYVCMRLYVWFSLVFVHRFCFFFFCLSCIRFVEKNSSWACFFFWWVLGEERVAACESCSTGRANRHFVGSFLGFAQKKK